MGAKSKRKGKTGELEAAKQRARLFGCQARRGQQFAGSPDSPDIVCDIPGIHLEVKRAERLSLYAALDQAIDDSGEAAPVVLHRASRQPWVAIVRLEDLPAVVERLYLQLMARHG